MKKIFLFILSGIILIGNVMAATSDVKVKL